MAGLHGWLLCVYIHVYGYIYIQAKTEVSAQVKARLKALKPLREKALKEGKKAGKAQIDILADLQAAEYKSLKSAEDAFLATKITEIKSKESDPILQDKLVNLARLKADEITCAVLAYARELDSDSSDSSSPALSPAQRDERLGEFETELRLKETKPTWVEEGRAELDKHALSEEQTRAVDSQAAKADAARAEARAKVCFVRTFASSPCIYYSFNLFCLSWCEPFSWG